MICSVAVAVAGLLITACVTAFVSIGLFLAAREMPAGPSCDDGGDGAAPG